MIQLEKISAHIGQHQILNNLSLTLESGLVALIGANGAGKSTLLHLLADGGRQADMRVSGTILLDEKSLSTYPSLALAQRRAFLPQQHTEHIPLSVRDILRLAFWPHGTHYNAENCYQEALQRWDLSALLTRSWRALSGGERQRVQLARTWIQIRLQEDASKRIWLLDEPQNTLDFPHQQQLQQCLKEVAQQGALVMFSTHDINFALHSADRILALGNGCILADGSADELANSTALQPIFGIPFTRLTDPHSGRPWLIPQ